jgi:dTMP kinase
MKGKFITLEGVDGAGKSTFIPWIEARLQSKGVDVLVTREPGGTPVGEQLRQILLHGSVCADTEALLMFAARREHLVSVIVPALAKGRWVLCDRFTDATFAYQGAGRGVGEDWLVMLERWIQGELRPDLTLLFDLPVEVARARSAASRMPDRFESERSEFFLRVREGYLRRAAKEPARIRIIDSSRPIAEVERQLTAIELLK